MHRSVTVLLTVLLAVMVLGLALAVPQAGLREETVERHKQAYQPEEFDFLNDFGQETDGDTGLDFGDDDAGIPDFGEEEDYGIDFGDD